MQNNPTLPSMRHVALVTFLALNLLGCATHVIVAPEEQREVLSYWQQGRDYQAQGRFELARQQYTLALASSHESDTQRLLQRDLLVVTRMLHAMR